MASTLFDTIQQNLSQSSGQTAPQQDQTLRAKKLFQAKSGRAVGDDSSAPISQVGEQAANAETNAGLQQVGQQAQLQNQQIQAGQEAVGQKSQEQQGLLEARRKANTVENTVKTNQLLQSLEQGKGKMDVQQDQATKQQIAFGLRMQNQEYVDNLQRAGASARLDNDASFKEELEKSVLGDKQDLLKQSLGDKSILDMSDREFKEKMSQMDLDNAYDMFGEDLKLQKKKNQMAGISGATKGGIGAFAGGGGSGGE